MCRLQTFLGLLLVIALVAVSGVFAGEIRQSGFEHFITRDGDRLMDGDQEFRFIGVNMPGLNLPYDYFYGIPQRMVLPTPWEQEDGFKTMDENPCHGTSPSSQRRTPRDAPAETPMARYCSA